MPGQTGHTRVRESGELVIRTAKQYGKLVAVGSMPSDFKFWVKAGADVLFCTNDTSCLRIGAQVVLQQAREAAWKIIPHANSRLPQFGEYSLGPAVWRLKQNEKGETDRTVLLISPHD